jgi:hypothetical protein
VQVSNVLVLDKIIEYFLNDLGIVFHSHRVEFPRELSAQVLPRPLLDLALERLENIKSQVPNFKLVKQYPQLLKYTLDQIQDNINYLTARDQSHRWQDCVEFNRRLDSTRAQSFITVTPEFKKYA